MEELARPWPGSFERELRSIESTSSSSSRTQIDLQRYHPIEEAVQKLEQSDLPHDTDRYASLLRICGRAKALSQGRRVHAHIVRCGCRSSTFIANLLIQMYGRCGDLEQARAVFDHIHHDRNLFSWAILMAAYVLNHQDKIALQLFREMDHEGIRAESATFVSVIGACAGLGDLAAARMIYERVCAADLDTISVSGAAAQSDVVVETALVNMFGKCKGLQLAREIFDGIKNKNQVTWNAMITAYAQNGRNREAMELYWEMDREGVRPDESTFPSILAACGNLEEAKIIHQRIRDCCLELDVVVGTALVNMYGRFRVLEQAEDVFLRMRHKNVITWCAMISAYAQNGQARQALDFYKEMLRDRHRPNFVTYLSVLEACSWLGDLQIGREIHGRVIAVGLHRNISVRNALINMYGKCGSLIDARMVFDDLCSSSSSISRDLISWNSIIEAYAQLGFAAEAVEVFQEMRLDGTKPDEVTFLEIIFACSHGGMLAEGLSCFCSMVEDERLRPMEEHYKGVVDLLGRAGKLREAESLVRKMEGMEGDCSVAWTTLMGACLIHGSTQVRAGVAERVVEEGDEAGVDHARYVLLSNLYSSNGPAAGD